MRATSYRIQCLPRLPGLLLALGVLVGGCATRVDVLPIASNGPAVYDLRGRRLEDLQTQARQLCPKGHDTLRSWQQLSPADAQSGLISNYWMKATDWMDPASGDRAQLVIQCAAA